MTYNDELGRAVERLTGCADDDEAHWSMDPREGWAVDVPVSDLRLILSANREMREKIEAAEDRIDGFETDLRLAVQVAWKRGAKEWATLNYPGWVDWLKSCDESDAARSALTTQRGDGE